MSAAALWGRVDRVPRSLRVVGQEILVVGLSLGCVLLSRPTGLPFAEPAAIVASVALPLRLRWPWLTMLLSLVALAGELGLAPAAFALYRIGRTTDSRAVRLGWLVAAVVAPQLTVMLTEQLNWRDGILSALFSASWGIAPMAAGVLMRTRQRLTGSLADLRRAREAELVAREDQARAQERARIGQEIHDSVGHHATLIVVEAAGLAATVSEPEARVIAQRIRKQAKESLAEMRAAIGLVGRGVETASGLREVSELIGEVRGAGMAVDFRDDSGVVAENGGEVSLPAPVERAVFRIVQESLTNAARHAPGSAVTVRLARDGAVYTVVVASGPPVETGSEVEEVADGWASGGMGLTGMIERARTVGGELQVERGDEGRFTIRARLPLQGYSPSKVGGSHPTIGGIGTARNAR